VAVEDLGQGSSSADHRFSSVKATQSSMRIIVAEDEVVSRRVLEANLRRLGHDSELHADGLKALESFRKHPADLLILDWLLPGMDGVDVCRDVRGMGVQGEMAYILMVTGRSRDEDVAAALDAGADDYVSKPVDAEVLDLRLRIAARRAGERRALRENRERFQAVFAATGDYVITVDAATSEIFDITNSGCERIGMALEELVGTSMTAIDPRIEVLLNAVAKPDSEGRAGSYRLDSLHHRQGGEPYPVEVVAVAGSMRGRPVVHLHCRDITDRMRAEQSLRAHARDLERSNFLLDGLSKMDSLTGIPNRRFFDRFMDSKERRRVGSKAPLAMLMVDIDHFKAFNDAMGHVAGDGCLRRVAESLRDNLHRSTDFVARYGGEEFVVVLRDTGLEGAIAVGERLRAAIEGLRIAHPARKDGLNIATISIGAASTETMPDSVANIELLAAADQALYEAKGAGRNRVWAQASTS